MKQLLRFSSITGAFLVVCCALFLTACGGGKTGTFRNESSIPSYVPTNHAGIPILPASIRRVVILPMYWNADAGAGFLEFMDATMTSELNKTNLIEVVPLSRKDMVAVFGKSQIASYEVIPADSFDRLRAEYAADAVLMIDLTGYRAYKPLYMGIRSKLINIQTGESLWAFDNSFDAGDPTVAMGARRFAQLRDTTPYPLDTDSPILISPRLFSRYVAFMTFSTLPPR